ncbi:hypothetical protein ASC90_13395 [Rhizobium sp. Root1220]|nr:hypothetical protein ASC90_13395 [Rhizobium sp. Root1220]
MKTTVVPVAVHQPRSDCRPCHAVGELHVDQRDLRVLRQFQCFGGISCRPDDLVAQILYDRLEIECNQQLVFNYQNLHAEMPYPIQRPSATKTWKRPTSLSVPDRSKLPVATGARAPH